jgi:hypothetical protein
MSTSISYVPDAVGVKEILCSYVGTKPSANAASETAFCVLEAPAIVKAPGASVATDVKLSSADSA